MRTDDEYVYSYLPDGDDAWLVYAWGELFLTGGGSFAIGLILVLIERSTGSQPDVTQKSEVSVEVRIPIAALSHFPIGSIWRNKKLIRVLSEYREPRRLFFEDLSRGEARKLGEVVTENCPMHAKDIPVLLFKKKRDYQYTSFDVIIFPRPSIAKYYFFKSHHSIHHVVAGSIEDQYNRFFDPNKSMILIDDKNLKIATIWLERDTEDSDAYKAARMAFDKYYLYKARLVGKKRADAMRENRPAYIEADFPIDGKSYLDVRGRYFKEKNITYFFVYSIKKCLRKEPWDSLFFSSDRDNTKSEVGEDINQTKKRTQTRRVPITEGINKVGSDSSDSWLESVQKDVMDDEEFNFDLNQIERFPKDFQKYKNLTNISRRPITPGGLTSNHEIDGNSDKALLKAQYPNALDELENVFEGLNEVTDRLRSRFLDRLEIRYLVPFPNSDKDYEGFSIFPLAQLVNNLIIFNWCHVKKIRKGKWGKPRRIRLIEFCFDSLHYSYVIEVQQRSKDELTLLSIKQRSGHKIPLNVFETLLFDGAREKCVWKNLKGKYEESYDLVSMRHTTVDALYSRIVQRLNS